MDCVISCRECLNIKRNAYNSGFSLRVVRCYSREETFAHVKSFSAKNTSSVFCFAKSTCLACGLGQKTALTPHWGVIHYRFLRSATLQGEGFLGFVGRKRESLYPRSDRRLDEPAGETAPKVSSGDEVQNHKDLHLIRQGQALPPSPPIKGEGFFRTRSNGSAED